MVLFYIWNHPHFFLTDDYDYDDDEIGTFIYEKKKLELIIIICVYSISHKERKNKKKNWKKTIIFLIFSLFSCQIAICMWLWAIYIDDDGRKSLKIVSLYVSHQHIYVFLLMINDDFKHLYTYFINSAWIEKKMNEL